MNWWIFLKARDEEQERMFQEIKDNFDNRLVDSVTPFEDEREKRLRSMAMNILPRQENVARRNIKINYDQPSYHHHYGAMHQTPFNEEGVRGTTFDEQAGSEQPTLRANIRRLIDDNAQGETFEGRDKRDARDPSYRPGGMEELPEKLKQMQEDAKKKQKERKMRQKEQRERMSPAEKREYQDARPGPPVPRKVVERSNDFR